MYRMFCQGIMVVEHLISLIAQWFAKLSIGSLTENMLNPKILLCRHLVSAPCWKCLSAPGMLPFVRQSLELLRWLFPEDSHHIYLVFPSLPYRSAKLCISKMLEYSLTCNIRAQRPNPSAPHFHDSLQALIVHVQCSFYLLYK